MQIDRVLKNALMFSLVLHLFIFIGLPRPGAFKKVDMQEDVEFTFLPDKKAPIDSNLIAEKQTIETLRNLPKPGDIHGKIERPEQLSKPFASRHEHATIKVDVSDKPDIAESKQPLAEDNMLISHETKDLSSDPVYLDYYNAVRSQIYKSAQANRPYYFMEGGVNLVFTLSKTGRLLSVGIAQEKSTLNPVLQRHALSSIERASPFSPFHESMKEDQLTLRITISFEK
jgi:TonB family protein